MDDRKYYTKQRQIHVPQRGYVSAVPSRGNLRSIDNAILQPSVQTVSAKQAFQAQQKAQIGLAEKQQKLASQANLAQRRAMAQRITLDSASAQQQAMRAVKPLSMTVKSQTNVQFVPQSNPMQNRQQQALQQRVYLSRATAQQGQAVNRAQAVRPAVSQVSQFEKALAQEKAKASLLSKAHKAPNKVVHSKTAVLAAVNNGVVVSSLSQIPQKISSAKQNLQDKLSDFRENVSTQSMLRYGLVTVCLVVAGFLAYDTWKTNQQIQQVYNNEPVASATPMEEAPEVIEEPAQEPEPAPAGNVLRIPSIGVSAGVIDVGLTPDNAIATPDSLTDVGWYNGSAYPGQNGAVFLTGHYNAAGYGVFNNLSNVNVGDEIFIDTEGSTVHYVVSGIETVSVNSIDMAKILNGPNDKETLTIMTCAGVYNGQQFTDRTIVYAERS